MGGFKVFFLISVLEVWFWLRGGFWIFGVMVNWVAACVVIYAVWCYGEWYGTCWGLWVGGLRGAEVGCGYVLYIGLFFVVFSVFLRKRGGNQPT